MDRQRICLLLTWLLVAVLAACGRSGPSGSSGAGAGADSPRIVSLSPAITRTLVDLGLESHLVGRSSFCTSVDPAIPVCGDLLTADLERLARLEPTHLLLQPPAGGADPALLELARDRGWTVGQWKLDRLDDIEQLILDLPGRLFGSGDPRRARAAARAGDLTNRLALALSPGPAPPWRGRVLLVQSADPVLVFGRGTYLHEVLVALGGVNATVATGWATLSLEDVVRTNPDAVVLVVAAAPEGDGARAALEVFRGLNVAAARTNRLAILSHPDALLPSSGVIGVAEALRAVLSELGRATP